MSETDIWDILFLEENEIFPYAVECFKMKIIKYTTIP
jgi:hypothetical protein